MVKPSVGSWPGDWLRGTIRNIDPRSQVADVALEGDHEGITILACPPLPDEGGIGDKWGWTEKELVPAQGIRP